MDESVDRRRPLWYQVVTTLLAVSVGGLVYWLSITYFPYHSIDHREAVYLQQAALLLKGQLAFLPPVADVFHPWLFTRVGERLYPPTTPVPAAMFGVGKLVGGSFRLSLALIAAGNVALVCAIGTELFDPPTGLIAGGLLAASPLFLINAALFLPYVPTLLWLLLFVYGYLLTIRLDGWLAPVLGGIAGGLAVFARPYSAALTIGPIAVHAGYTLWNAYRNAEWGKIGQLGLIAALGSGFVVGSIVYRLLVPGPSMIGLLPIEPIATADGLGYTVEGSTNDATRSVLSPLSMNGQVLIRLFTSWTPIGVVGTFLAGLGAWLVVAQLRQDRPDRDRRLGRRLAVAGITITIPLGNLAVPNTTAILGDPSIVGDGLFTFVGPFYHLELLVPLTVLGAHGLDWLWGHVRQGIDRFDTEAPAETAIVIGILGGVLLATAAGGVMMPHLRANDRITDQYAVAYSPLVDRSFDEALVLLPTPYADRLNYPFQFLRNEPGFDGSVVYAIDAGPRNFATVDAFSERQLYRYVYRGRWAPTYGQAVRGRLQPVTAVRGHEVRLRVRFTIPSWIEHVSIHLSTGDGQRYYGLERRRDTTRLTVVLTPRGASVTGEAIEPLSNETALSYNRSDYLGLAIFLNAGTGGGATYRALFPVRRTDRTVRTMTPYLELCRSPSWCGGEAAYIPGAVPDGLSIETTLSTNTTDT